MTDVEPNVEVRMRESLSVVADSTADLEPRRAVHR